MAVELKPGITLYLARHGETIANVEHRFQGQNDTPLTGKGRAQARMLGAILKPRLSVNALPRFVCSPMPRARTTMEIMLDALSLPRSYGVDDRLMEINLGDWSGLTDQEAKALDPKKWDERIHDKWNVRVPGGGENYAMVADRIHAWIADVKETTVAISHGAFTRIFRGLFANLSWQEMSALDEPQDCVFAFSGNKVERLEYSGAPV